MVFGPQLARHRAEDPRADRLVLAVHDHGGGAVEADHRTVLALDALGRAHHDRAQHVALLHAAARDGFLDRNDDRIADAGVAAPRPAQHLDALNAAGAGVVGDLEVGLHLDHDAAPSFGRTSQVLSFERGAHSTMRAVSPTL